MTEFTAQALTNMTWAFATVSQSDKRLFVTFARAVERHMSMFIAAELAITVWAFATVDNLDKQLFARLVSTATRSRRSDPVVAPPPELGASFFLPGSQVGAVEVGSACAGVGSPHE